MKFVCKRKVIVLRVLFKLGLFNQSALAFLEMFRVNFNKEINCERKLYVVHTNYAMNFSFKNIFFNKVYLFVFRCQILILYYKIRISTDS